MTHRPLCFVVMPFGRKTDESGRILDFDYIYQDLIEPAIRSAGLEPLRADHELSGGMIHQAMFERLMLCDFALADLSLANPNVYYELGARHGARPHTTVLIAASATRLPFDLGPVRCYFYGLDGQAQLTDAALDQRAIGKRLESARSPADDSPLYQLVNDWPRPDLARLKTEQFRTLVEYSSKLKKKLAAARHDAKDARNSLFDIEKTLLSNESDPALLIDLLLSYRAVNAHSDMVRLVSIMPTYLSHTVPIREQLAFALNRLGERDHAEEILRDIVSQNGSSSETNGLLGRIYKDRWQDSRQKGEDKKARAFLRKAINFYLEGFEADLRDAYPGVNAVTLMEVIDPSDPRQGEILPVVSYAVKRRLRSGRADYWDFASHLELLVLARREQEATDALEEALSMVRESWEAETTARNLSLIAQVRRERGEDVNWIDAIISELGRWRKEGL